jgi:S-formylglutathione hydrolase FrmB
VEYVDTKYKTINAREGRAITGLSMGGHGAMWISLRHSDVFGAAGSIAGGVDFRPFPFNWEIKDLLGSEADNQLVWDSHTAISQICRVKNGRLALIIDCGYSDFFFEVNNLFHQELLKYKINHDFIVREGGHNWAYFTKSIDYQLLFFSNFFYNKKEDKK